MKEIPLTQGKVAFVDDDMYDYLMQWKWCYNCGYAVRNEYYRTQNGKRISKMVRMHRVITNAPDGMEVDHRDRIATNNQRSNLRLCTRDQNNINRVFARNTSGFNGVRWHKRDEKWIAQISFNKKRIHLGSFESPIEAAKSYNLAALEYHGEFAKLNEV